MSTVTNRIVSYLKQNTSRWVPVHEIVRAGEGAQVPRMDVVRGLREVDEMANIGRVWNKETRVFEYRYYEPREGDDLMQKAIDEF